MEKLDVQKHVHEPLLESFTVEGLNDYKNITLRLEKNVKIVAAENGTGKTTLLNLLYGLLAGKPKSLRSIDFKKLTLKIRDHDTISITKEELVPQINDDYIEELKKKPTISNFFKRGLINEEFKEVLSLYVSDAYEDLSHCSGYRKMFSSFQFDKEEIRSILDRIVSQKFTSDSKFTEIKNALDGVNVLYLPTYRRIEADLPEFEFDLSEFSRRVYESRVRKNGTRYSRSSDWESDRLIFFGLQDVEQRLKSITSEIRESTLQAYSRISAKTLDRLLIKDPSSIHLPDTNIDVDTLKVVLARLGKTDSDSEDRIMALIKSKEINSSDNDTLRSFLIQLIEIYQEKRESEKAIEDFVSVVDSYWQNPFGEKKFEFDKFAVSVHVKNEYTQNQLPLNALSSGEKQIVSIFARLYLETEKKYLILIDEPELSLSMEWQQKILPDILAAPSCEQLIAITHSPFIFDNELDPYAGSFDISYVGKK